jgi:acyl-coenzyme A synthetase/AMP-(fatty) acid ligase
MDESEQLYFDDFKIGARFTSPGAVVGKPDALRGHIVKAYVVLKPGRAVYPGLEGEIVDVVKSHVGKYQYPREIEFLDQLPKTETGKIQRFLLRQQ